MERCVSERVRFRTRGCVGSRDGGHFEARFTDFIYVQWFRHGSGCGQEMNEMVPDVFSEIRDGISREGAQCGNIIREDLQVTR